MNAELLSRLARPLSMRSTMKRLTMRILNLQQLAVCIAAVACFASATSAAEILIADAKSQPESLTVAPGGVLIVGSASTPFIYKVPSGSTSVEKFVDASAEGPGTFFFGILADAA